MFIAGEPMNPATKTFFGVSYSVRGVSTCWSTPSRSTATRCPMVIASTWSCVTYTVVVPNCACRVAICDRVCTRSLASRLDSGSSMRKTCGLRTIARPMATRCRWPPDSALGLRLRYSSNWSSFAAFLTAASISCFGVFRSFSANAMFSYTVMCGYRA